METLKATLEVMEVELERKKAECEQLRRENEELKRGMREMEERMRAEIKTSEERIDEKIMEKMRQLMGMEGAVGGINTSTPVTGQEVKGKAGKMDDVKGESVSVKKKKKTSKSHCLPERFLHA